MKKPIILAVDDDSQVMHAIHRDLRKEYKDQYRVLSTQSARDALESLLELRNKGEDLALVLSDQRMPEMSGVEFLGQVKQYFPQSKLVLLTAYSDIQAAIKAINDVQLDYYLMKPWDPPDEKLYPVLNDLLDDWLSGYIPTFKGIRIVGFQWSPKSHEIKDFLSGNMITYQWLDVESDLSGRKLLEINEINEKQLPAVFFEDGSFLCAPVPADIAGKLGLQTRAGSAMYDVAIIGAGPAGLAAAVYGGSEGLKTVLIEKRGPGGQAGTSSRIENYLGFPKGLSGSELARRAITQATRFGIEFLAPQQVERLEFKDQYKILTLADGTQINTRSILIATGVDYRRLEAPGIAELTGAGVYYGAASTEANACKESDVYVIGGGNSAGQAALYLARFARMVRIVIRKKDLRSSMSSYLIEQIAATENVEILPETVVVEVAGNNRLEKVVLEGIDGHGRREVQAGALFIFIGARPYTDWLPEAILKDGRGFVRTGSDLKLEKEFQYLWKLPRTPYLLETSVAGVFASGDVRAGAMNRVASAVGEGSMAIKFVHQYLAES